MAGDIQQDHQDALAARGPPIPVISRENEPDQQFYIDALKNLPLHDQVLDALAAPFQYQTGMYFRGRRTFRIKWCGICTILMGMFLLISFFALFDPVFTGDIISAELETTSFNTPADVPNNKTVPTSLGQFFGRKTSR